MRTTIYTALLAISFSLFFISFEKEKPVTLNSSFKSGVTYINDIAPIVDFYCTTCHAGKSPAADLDLTTYELVKQACTEGDLLNRIVNKRNPMPSKGLMPKSEINKIYSWAESGFEEGTELMATNTPQYSFNPPTIKPVEISPENLQLLELVQGHWVGDMNLMGADIPWFAFDFRPTSESEVFGMFEGGTMGNLFTAFFIADYKGTPTIMARNGGILSGIYRTSYFVLTKAKVSRRKSSFRLVDAYGGSQIMWMDLEFKNGKFKFTSYTSGLGMTLPKKHMEFVGENVNPQLSAVAAKTYNFPQFKINTTFSNGIPAPDWGDQYPVVTSASYIYADTTMSYEALGDIAKDPIPYRDVPGVGRMHVNLNMDTTENNSIHLYISKEPLTNSSGAIETEYGYIKMQDMNKVLLFSEIAKGQTDFIYQYLHCGEHYITAFIDVDGDFTISKGDRIQPSLKIDIREKETLDIKLTDHFTLVK